MAAWPSSLPQRPLADGYVEAPQSATIRTDMDVGPAKIRRRYTAEIRVFSMGLLLTTTQAATLKTFYDTTLTGGVDPFDWIDHRTGAAASYRFRSPPSYAEAGPGYWRTTLDLEAIP